MSNQALSMDVENVESESAAAGLAESSTQRARPIPRVSIQVFCETEGVASTFQTVANDRRFSKAHVSIHMGGTEAAIAQYKENPTPNLIVTESGLQREQMLAQLDSLADCCDEGTRVIVVGHHNDVILYRELLKRGVSEYLVTPVRALDAMECISNLYNDPDTDPVGHVYAFVGAKGGVGSSTICHNTSWVLSETLQTDVVVADLDMAFGTTGLDFNQDPVQGIAEALSSPERLDEVLLDRLLTKCSEHLSIFAAPVVLDQEYDLSAEACDSVIDVVRQNVPFVAVDLPHTWTSWTKRLLTQADEVVVTAQPDLANLRNAKNIVDFVKANRQNDSEPLLMLNMTNMPKRPEIAANDFSRALEIETVAEIDFDIETFGQAANNGQMIEELNPKAKAVPAFRKLAMALTHRKPVEQEKKSRLSPILEKLKLGR